MIARLHKIGGEERSFIVTVLQSVVFVSRQRSEQNVHLCKVECVLKMLSVVKTGLCVLNRRNLVEKEERIKLEFLLDFIDARLSGEQAE